MPYISKPDGWRRWHVKNPQPMSSSSIDLLPKDEGKFASEEAQEENKIYDPGNPIYSPRHQPEFYEDE